MPNLELREMHLIKQALATAVLAIERAQGPFQPSSDLHEMKLLLDRLTSDAELDHYARAAWISLYGTLPPSG